MSSCKRHCPVFPTEPTFRGKTTELQGKRRKVYNMIIMNFIKRFLEKHDVLNKIKQHKVLYKKGFAPFRWECPNCTVKAYRNDPYSHTVSLKHLWDEQYHKYKFYMGCSNCNYVTPAFEEPNKAYEIYEDNLIDADHRETIKMFE